MRGTVIHRKLKNLRELRENLGMTQQDLCDEIGLTRARLSDLELRKRSPSVETVDGLSTFFGLGPEDLLEPAAATIEDKLDAVDARLGRVEELLRALLEKSSS